MSEHLDRQTILQGLVISAVVGLLLGLIVAGLVQLTGNSFLRNVQAHIASPSTDPIFELMSTPTPVMTLPATLTATPRATSTVIMAIRTEKAATATKVLPSVTPTPRNTPTATPVRLLEITMTETPSLPTATPLGRGELGEEQTVPFEIVYTDQEILEVLRLVNETQGLPLGIDQLITLEAGGVQVDGEGRFFNQTIRSSLSFSFSADETGQLIAVIHSAISNGESLPTDWQAELESGLATQFMLDLQQRHRCFAVSNPRIQNQTMQFTCIR